jgi:predicted RNA-binding protein with PUA-like domain
MNYWLLKSEPNVFSIGDLQQQKQTIWDGVRNYQARNFLRQMEEDDRAFFYHSNTKNPAIVGLMKVIANHVIDPTQFDRHSDYYDSKSTLENPRWQTVKVEFIEEFCNYITLDRLKQEFKADELILARKGNRLSVLPIADEIYQRILAMATIEVKN